MVDVAGISSTILNIAIIIVSIMLGLGLAGATFWGWLRWKRFKEYKVVVWERDAFGQATETYDKAGVFVDPKTNYKRLFLKKAKVGLNADSIPFIPTKNGKIVYLYKTGLKNYRFIRPVLKELARIEVGEEDVNWSLNAYERAKKAFTEAKLLQYLPYISLAFVSIIILVIFIYLFKELGSMKELASILRDMSANVAQAKSGTTILP